MQGAVEFITVEVFPLTLWRPESSGYWEISAAPQLYRIFVSSRRFIREYPFSFMREQRVSENRGGGIGGGGVGFKEGRLSIEISSEKNLVALESECELWSMQVGRDWIGERVCMRQLWSDRSKLDRSCRMERGIASMIIQLWFDNYDLKKDDGVRKRICKERIFFFFFRKATVFKALCNTVRVYSFASSRVYKYFRKLFQLSTQHPSSVQTWQPLRHS